MKPLSKRVLYIFKTYYADEAKKRLENFLTMADAFMQEQTFEFDSYFIDSNRLVKAVDSYFLDVIKYKEYHFDSNDTNDIYGEDWIIAIHKRKKINDSKVAAFTAKWLLKTMPIYINPLPTQLILDDYACHINESFALQCALYCLVGKNFASIDSDDYDKLFYDFKYRPFDERAYFSRFELLEKNVSLKLAAVQNQLLNKDSENG